MPLPTSLVVKNGSKMRSQHSAGMPVPVSLHLQHARSGPAARSTCTAGVVLVERHVARASMRERPPSGMASRALTHRFSSTWWSCVGSPSTGHRSSGHVDVTRRWCFGNVSASDLLDVPDQVPQLDLHAVALDAAREGEHLLHHVGAALRAALDGARARRGASGRARPSCSSSIDIMIGARMLLRSWAMPPASVPMLSIRWARRNCASSCLRSVMSRPTQNIVSSSADQCAAHWMTQIPPSLRW